jgi:DNA-binding transcriptional LysR family regulator
MRFGSGVDRGCALTESGRATTVVVNGNRIANDRSLVRQWCLQGHGIALKSYWDVKTGRLLEPLKPFAPPASAVQAFYQGGSSISKRVRALIDALVQGFSGADDSEKLTHESASGKKMRIMRAATLL